MSRFRIHDKNSASDEGRKALARAEEAFGFAPNLIGILAGAPAAAHGYLDLGQRFHQSSLSDVEQQVVLLAASFENECEYCMAAHTGGAKQAGLDDASVEALRSGSPLDDEKLEALRGLVRSTVRDRGRPDAAVVEAFLSAGYERGQILDVILGVAMKTLSNYTNHIADTPLDQALEPLAWRPVTAQAAD